MNLEILLSILDKHVDSIGAAQKAHDADRIYSETKMVLILLRMVSRELLKIYVNLTSELRGFNRTVRKAKESGVTFTFADAKRKELETNVHGCRDILSDIGSLVFMYLNAWQADGATLKDLCDICAVNYELTMQEISEIGYEDIDFQSAIGALCIDYKDTRQTAKSGMYDYKEDAPLSHPVRMYMCKRLTESPELRERVMKEVFDESHPQQMHIIKDSKGKRHLFNANGEELGIVI